MNLQKIKSANGKDEYVLLPVAIYEALKDEIRVKLAHPKVKAAADDKYVPFVLEDYVDNPLALARMKSHFTQKQLAERMGVTQAYISKVERQDKVTPTLLERAIKAIRCKS
ncbi:MAG: helix-turn-helix transcriptional regulator [Sulfuritalea sp.]|jgi:DNA-binding XRE family transcriptional regulator|nr:helix-turn-helix transcriptional regulator [Sulfuritalea sp.]